MKRSSGLEVSVAILRKAPPTADGKQQVIAIDPALPEAIAYGMDEAQAMEMLNVVRADILGAQPRAEAVPLIMHATPLQVTPGILDPAGFWTAVPA